MKKVGRYEVAGLLATGGMAEILLGRLVGPSGFERTVVLKRMLPHLASEPTFVAMFNDEARIAARIQHPNVVQVQDFVAERGELVIVMEYLQGETLASLARRLAVRQIPLDLALGAHIVAEAAAGLHAAHELVDQRDRPVGLVHRDVSPQNLFVGYDGGVKVLDFGIAKVEGKLARTETGQLKGSFAYMSPEQCMAKKLDRRSDVFSLGVILYEITTGLRLFKRQNQLLMLKAITEAPITPPSFFVKPYPKALDKILLHALERDPAKRYQTAQEMRHDLLQVVAELRRPKLAEEALGALMREVFADRIVEKSELVSRLREGSRLIRIPSPETDLGTDLPTVEATIASKPADKPSQKVLALLALALLLLIPAAVVGGVATYLARGHASERPPSAAEEAPTRPAARAADAGQAATVVLRVESTPSKAAVWIDGRRQGLTPAELELPRSDEQVQLVLRRRGYAPLRVGLVPDSDQHLDLQLVEVGKRRGHPRGPGKHRSKPPEPTGSSPYERFD